MSRSDPDSGRERDADPEREQEPEAGSDIAFADSPILVYVIPFAGAVLVAAGIGAAIVGGYAPVQEELGLCGSPTIEVATPAETAELVGEGGDLSLDRLAFAELSPAEQRAFERALDAPFREAHVRGSFTHREAFEGGVLVEYRGRERYATLTSANNCTSVDPLLFPLGVVAILLGIVWLLAPPMYRRLATIERSSGATWWRR